MALFVLEIDAMVYVLLGQQFNGAKHVVLHKKTENNMFLEELTVLRHCLNKDITCRNPLIGHVFFCLG